MFGIVPLLALHRFRPSGSTGRDRWARHGRLSDPEFHAHTNYGPHSFSRANSIRSMTPLPISFFYSLLEVLVVTPRCDSQSFCISLFDHDFQQTSNAVKEKDQIRNPHLVPASLD